MPDLTPDEHPHAQKSAYLKSLARGDGKEPPPFDPNMSVGDFWQAAGEVIAQRTPVETAFAEFHFKVIVPLVADITRTLEVTCYAQGDDNHGSNFVGNGVVLSGIEAIAQFTDPTSAAERQQFAEEAKKRYDALSDDIKKYVFRRHVEVDGSRLAQDFMKKYFDEPVASGREFGVPVSDLIWAFRNAHLHAFYPYYKRTFNNKEICGGVRLGYLDSERRIGVTIRQLETRFDINKRKVYRIEGDWFLVCPQILFVFFKRAVDRFVQEIRRDDAVRGTFLENWYRLAQSYGVDA